MEFDKPQLSLKTASWLCGMSVPSLINLKFSSPYAASSSVFQALAEPRGYAAATACATVAPYLNTPKMGKLDDKGCCITVSQTTDPHHSVSNH